MALALRHCLVHVVQVGLNESDRMLRLNTRTHIVLTNPVIFSRKILIKSPISFSHHVARFTAKQQHHHGSNLPSFSGSLMYLNEATLLYNLRLRYAKNKIYVSTVYLVC